MEKSKFPSASSSTVNCLPNRKSSVEELNVNSLRNTQSGSDGKMKRITNRRNVSRTKKTYEHCGPTAQNENVSELTLSIQNFEFPPCINEANKGVLMVKNQNDLFQRTSSKLIPEAKMRGNDFTSSTNTHYEDLVQPVPKKFNPLYISRSTISPDESFGSIDSNFSEYARQKKVVTSEELVDTVHKQSGRRLNLHGAEWKQPCKASFVAGAPRKFIGACPYNYELLSKLSRPKQKFFLTQDPRKVHCLVNPEILRTKAYSKEREFQTLTKMVKHAQNTCVGTASESSESFICEVIDLENPLNLDFQGLDYKNTYQKDEQELQNQRNYHRLCRHLERKQIKMETAAKVEKQLFDKRISIPSRYNIHSRNVKEASPPAEQPVKLGKLYRAADKPYNKILIQNEKDNRVSRYKNLYLNERQRRLRNEADEAKRNEFLKDNIGMTLAESHFVKFKENIEDAIDRSFKKGMLLRKPEAHRSVYPHNIRETKVFKRNLKARNRIRRKEAVTKQEFYKERANKEKRYPEAELEISSSNTRFSNESKITESSDDEDDMVVGKDNDKFKLRGFQYLMSDNIRGKFHQRHKEQGTRKEKGCITREQWLRELAPKKEKVKMDIEVGIQKAKSPDDPSLNLFPPSFGFKPPIAKRSAVREFAEKPLGRHYERTRLKNLKFAKPRLRYRVKKFNLISYRFGDTAKRLAQINDPLGFVDHKQFNLKSTIEYMDAKSELEKQRQLEIKEKRLKLLGIPCKPVKKSRLQTKCENSESSTDSEWVPEQEPEYDEEKDIQRKDKLITNDMPLRQRFNMPAPKFREPTLRQHPRHPRDYDSLRIPSAMFDEVVLQTNVPHMYKLPPDLVNYANVASGKRPYTDMFNGRHHHDHWNPTQTKEVDVHYQAEVVKAEITKMKRKSDRTVVENFQMADPPCNYFIDMDLTLPKCDTEQMIKEHLSNVKKKPEEFVAVQQEDMSKQENVIYRSLDQEELAKMEYPGRQEFLKFLRDIKIAVQNNRQNDLGDDQLNLDKDALIQELEEDLQSIESCLTSLSSSTCTNLTNDSGSFLLMEGKEKIPLDYIRKSLVPFEELQRSRFKVESIHVGKQESNPWITLPFSGQRKAQYELTTLKDNFFTFNTRLKNGLRLRLEVPVQDVREQLLGRGSNKFNSVVTTDIDENYVDELKNRPPVKMFNFKCGHSLIKDALRLKFESLLIQGQIVRTKIYDRLNEQHWTAMQKVKLLYDNLFAKWEKREYESSMAVVYKVKSYYDETDRLKNEYRSLERQHVIMNMDIVFIEGHWIRCIMLQNFHYLMSDQKWRVDNDWIHGTYSEDTKCYKLENFEESIAKRSVVNIRQRDKDDAWAIKSFFEDIYIQNQHPILIVFPDADSFLGGIESLKKKTFVLLLEMHFTLAVHAELHGRLETFQKWCTEDLKEKERYVKRRCAKLYFMEDRAFWLRNHTLNFMEQPIEASFNNDTFSKDRAVITQIWRHVVPANMRGSSENDLQPMDMVAMISDVVMELITKFESIPMELSRSVEDRYRTRRAYQRKLSYQAYHIEMRIEMEMKNVVKNLEPPFQKPKRTGKLPRSIIKKRDVVVPIPMKRLTERTKFFFKAFHEDGEVIHSVDLRDSLAQVDTMQEQIVPFYFDHFLKLNGYTPNYNFKTQIEIRDGPEVNRLKIRYLIPEVMERIEQWELKKKRIMEEHISQNPKMYIDVI